MSQGRRFGCRAAAASRAEAAARPSVDRSPSASTLPARLLRPCDGRVPISRPSPSCAQSRCEQPSFVRPHHAKFTSSSLHGHRWRALPGPSACTRHEHNSTQSLGFGVPARERVGSGTATNCRTSALAMVLPHELSRLPGLHRSIDADRGRGFAITFTIVADDDPSPIRPLHDLGMVDFSQRLPLLLAAFSRWGRP